MADSVATRVARHRAKKRAEGVTRLTVELDRDTVSAIRRLCKRHSKTRRQLLQLAVHAADGLLAGRLKVARAATKPTASVIIRKPQERPQAPDKVAGYTNTPASPENTPTDPLREPEQPVVDDADARIRACAFVVEP